VFRSNDDNLPETKLGSVAQCFTSEVFDLQLELERNGTDFDDRRNIDRRKRLERKGVLVARDGIAHHYTNTIRFPVTDIRLRPAA